MARYPTTDGMNIVSTCLKQQRSRLLGVFGIALDQVR